MVKSGEELWEWEENGGRCRCWMDVDQASGQWWCVCAFFRRMTLVGWTMYLSGSRGNTRR